MPPTMEQAWPLPRCGAGTHALFGVKHTRRDIGLPLESQGGLIDAALSLLISEKRIR